MKAIYVPNSLCTLDLRILLLENKSLPADFGVNICDFREPWKNRKPQMLTGVEHWLVLTLDGHLRNLHRRKSLL